ncbi:MAG: hypothetical protein WD431_21140 [Cyclobacteriaceae bacterium]
MKSMAPALKKGSSEMTHAPEIAWKYPILLLGPKLVRLTLHCQQLRFTGPRWHYLEKIFASQQHENPACTGG